jgi:hypothetical protein
MKLAKIYGAQELGLGEEIKIYTRCSVEEL